MSDAGKILVVQVIPSGLVAAILEGTAFVPFDAYPETAHQMPNSGDHAADDQMLEAMAAFVNAGAASRLWMANTFVEAAVTRLYTMTLLGAPADVNMTLLAVRTPVYRPPATVVTFENFKETGLN